MSTAHAVFERMFEVSEDPWGFRNQWYEARKRDLLLACLPAARYRHAYQPGCANGELVAALAARCDRVLASDGAVEAVKLARQRVEFLSHVEIAQAWMPDQWPAKTFDLIVLSEFGFYLSATALSTLIGRAKQSLGNGGTLLACHWRHPVAGYALNGDTVHQMLDAHLQWPTLVHHQEKDLVIDVWCADPRSSAEHHNAA